MKSLRKLIFLLLALGMIFMTASSVFAEVYNFTTNNGSSSNNEGGSSGGKNGGSKGWFAATGEGVKARSGTRYVIRVENEDGV